MTATTPRTDSRRDYRHFPPEYADALREYDRRSRATDYDSRPFYFGPMSPRHASSTKRELYRYKMFLSAALDADPGDDYARSLFDIFNTLTLRIDRSADSDDVRIVFTINPVVAAMRRLNGGNNA